MKFTNYLVLFIVLIVTFHVSTTQANSNLKLVLVQAFFRHGYRTPTKEEARHFNVTDPTLYEPPHFSQLTNEGKQLMFKLGRLLRKEYNAFLGSYNPELVYAVSTDYDRTKMSLHLVLSGLYSPASNQIWNSQLNWIPIPYHYTKESDCSLIPYFCPKIIEIYTKVQSTSENFKNQTSKYTQMISYLEEKTGITYNENLSFHIGWTYYLIEYYIQNNLAVPSWCTEDIIKSLYELFVICVDSMSSTDELKRLNGGVLVRKVVEHLKAEDKTRKIYLYSTHDLALAAFTRSQNIDTFKIPPCGSSIIVEKYEGIQNNEYVRMLAWDTTGETFTVLKIGDCEEFCPMTKYLNITKSVIPTDLEVNTLYRW